MVRRSERARDHNAGFVSKHHQLGAITSAEFREQPAHVRLRSRVRHEQLLGNLRVRQAARNGAEDFVLAFRQRRQGRVRFDRRALGLLSEVFDQPPRDARRKQRFTFGDDSNRGQEVFGKRVLE